MVVLDRGTTNGATPPLQPDAGVSRLEPSTYLRYLPALYGKDPFIGRFLRIMEDVFSPVQTTVSRRTQQFDASLASPPMLEALAAWVGADLTALLPEDRARRYVKNALLLHRWRGTKRGLRMALEVATGQRPLITEFSPGMVLGDDAALGVNTALEDGRPLEVHVVFDCLEQEVESRLLHDIIRRYKPAHTSYTVSFRG